MRVALFGGSFDPPHAGHLMAMAYVLGCARVERLLMVPCYQHVFDKRLGPYEHRLAMCVLAAETFGGNVEVSDVERRLGGGSQTLRTVRSLLAERPGDTIVLAIGADLLEERERWHRYEELARLVEFFVVGRAGHPRHVEGGARVEVPDVSSTLVRSRIAARLSVEGLVPAKVGDYLERHRLYRGAAP